MPDLIDLAFATFLTTVSILFFSFALRLCVVMASIEDLAPVIFLTTVSILFFSLSAKLCGVI